ncbi:hypothetical protein BYT27DRAFT_7208291 [Phlegmacium glaucopus]|nr:hypothetical protein BYT27DRAFT_7208291 [Phlegmacium glaucopus]
MFVQLWGGRTHASCNSRVLEIESLYFTVSIKRRWNGGFGKYHHPARSPHGGNYHSLLRHQAYCDMPYGHFFAKPSNKVLNAIGTRPKRLLLAKSNGFTLSVLDFGICDKQLVLPVTATNDVADKKVDPCAVIGGKEWVAPQDVRACFTSVKVDESINTNSCFQTMFTKIYLLIWLGFNNRSYHSDFDLHIDLSRTLKRLNDVDSLFLNFLPTPLSLLTDSDGSQNVHISPEVFQLSGAKVLEINGQDPFVAIDANAQITGSSPRGATGWNYILGNFSQQSLLLSDSVTLKLQLVGQSTPVNVVLPYRSRFGAM